MDKDVPIVVFSVFEGTAIPDNHHIDLMELKLDISGKLLHIYIGAENKPAKLSDMIPLARLLSAKITSTIKEHIINSGDTIACHAKCSDCCRYLVPLAFPEAMQLTKEVTAMAKWKRRFVNESTLLTARRILELTPKHSLEKITKVEVKAGFNLKNISYWYGRMNLPCPFLLNNLCTIYEQRPIACREHLAIGPASNCKVNSTNQPQLLQTPISVLEALAQLTGELEGTTPEAIILPFALVWCRENPEYFNHTWSASQLLRRFINILTVQNRHNNKVKPQKMKGSI